MKISQEKLSRIIKRVPLDYYQNGVKHNILQRIWHRNKLNIVINLIHETPQKILDVGCASGWFLSHIATHYPTVKCVGVDIYKEAIDYGNKRYKTIKLIQGDAQQLPFPNEFFDLIICTEVLEHVTFPKKVLNEIERVLTPGGKAILEMDTGNILFRLVWYWWTRIRKSVWTEAHLQFFDSKKLEKLIIKNGFRVIKRKVFNFSMAVAFLVEKK